MQLKKLVQRLIIVSAVISTPLFIQGNRNNDVRENIPLGTPNIQGTWYQHGVPYKIGHLNKEHHFYFWSLKQHGTNILGERQYELYDNPSRVNGTIENNRLTLTNIGGEGYDTILRLIVEGNHARGRGISTRGKKRYEYNSHLERVNARIR